ncbi:MAG: hypothetical protein ACREJU_17165 [Nitrospiraceae bacterium]
MARTWQNLTMKQTLLAIPVGVMIMIAAATGCSAMNDRVLPANPESRVVSNGTADDYFAAAFLYQQEAQKQAETAAAYERRAEALDTHVDPKGFRRAGFITTAQKHRRVEGDMQQLYAAHQNKALTLIGKQQVQ